MTSKLFSANCISIVLRSDIDCLLNVRLTGRDFPVYILNFCVPIPSCSLAHHHDQSTILLTALLLRTARQLTYIYSISVFDMSSSFLSCNFKLIVTSSFTWTGCNSPMS